jgi:mRNA-degrading endonuclease toxin of MazEF toxin-antitoxin module
VRRGEVWWHEPPGEKRRPVLILTRTEAKSLLTERVTELGPDLMDQVCRALAYATSC